MENLQGYLSFSDITMQFSKYIHTHLCVYVYMCVCVCLSVCLSVCYMDNHAFSLGTSRTFSNK